MNIINRTEKLKVGRKRRQNMKYIIAPMEGITYPEYRAVHSRLFSGAEAYYAPFVAPGSGGFRRGFLERRLPEADSELNVVPQILANSADSFLDTAHILIEMGFKEVNLNAGCPSGTVFSKHKGAGMLLDLDSLDRFLEEVYASADYPVSIKTRMGVDSVGEFETVLRIYEKYPVSLLTVHSRARSGFYKSEADMEAFAEICGNTKLSLCYNGDIFTAESLACLNDKAPDTERVMLARGIAANPALGRILQGGEALSKGELLLFHDTLLEAYLSSGLGERNACERMKELWFYMICLFSDCSKENKAILKSRSLQEYRTAVRQLTDNCRFDGAWGFHNVSPGNKFT